MAPVSRVIWRRWNSIAWPVAAISIMDQMVLRPTVDVEEQQTEVDQNPWLVRKKRGVIKTWFAMIGRAMVAPGQLMRATPEPSSFNQALWYTILTTTLV